MWSHQRTYAIGGLENVGYFDNEEKLLILSNQGIGVIDCLAGITVFRSEEEWWPFFVQDTSTLKSIPGYSDTAVKVFGLHNDTGLFPKTFENWQLSLSEPRADDPPFQHYTIQEVCLENVNSSEKLAVAKDGPCEFRAYGFSGSGKLLFAASSCEVVVWRRD